MKSFLCPKKLLGGSKSINGKNAFGGLQLAAQWTEEEGLSYQQRDLLSGIDSKMPWSKNTIEPMSKLWQPSTNGLWETAHGVPWLKESAGLYKSHHS